MNQRLRSWMTWAALGCALLGMVACAAPAAPADEGTDPAPAAPSALAGREWQLLVFASDEGEVQPFAGPPLTLNFGEDGRVSGSAGCNSFGGQYQAEGEQLALANLAQTEMACADAAQMAQEASYIQALSRVSAFALAGDTLTLQHEGGTLRFARVAPPADQSLEGTPWQLETMVMGDAASSLVAGSTISATFAAGQLSGMAGCNQYSTSYTLDGDTLTVAPVALTRMACADEGVMAQEQRFVTALQAAQRLTIEGDRLTLTHPDGSLVFVAGSPTN